MQRRRKTKFRPDHDHLESRALLSLAVLDIQNASNYNIGFDFRWSSSSSWSYYSESPGKSVVLSTNYSSSLSPQVLYDMTPSPYSETEVSLVQGYGEWSGTGSPPASAGTQYAFENTTFGVELYYLSNAHAHSDTDAHTDSDTDAHTDSDTHADSDAHAQSQRRRRVQTGRVTWRQPACPIPSRAR